MVYALQQMAVKSKISEGKTLLNKMLSISSQCKLYANNIKNISWIYDVDDR